MKTKDEMQANFKENKFLQIIFPEILSKIQSKDKTMVKKRLCLKCRKPFMSLGKHSRLCSLCNSINSRWVLRETYRME